MQKQLIDVKVTVTSKTYIIGTYNDYSCLCHISNISDFFIRDINKVITVGEIYKFEALEIDDDNKRIKLSYKSLRPEMLKKKTPQETLSGFTNLKAIIDELIEI